jgi:hypothetical protein
MQPSPIYARPEPQELGLQSKGRRVSQNARKLLSKRCKSAARPFCMGFSKAALKSVVASAKYVGNSAGKLEITVVCGSRKLRRATLTLQKG